VATEDLEEHLTELKRFASERAEDSEDEVILPAVDPDFVTVPPPKRGPPKSLFQQAAREYEGSEGGTNAFMAIAAGFFFLVVANMLD
jgi:hypothetical protein